MITGLKRVLNSGNLDEIEKFILDKEYEYYTGDGDKLVDSYEDLEFQIPNYDLLTKALGIKDSQSPIITEMYLNETRTITNKIDVYSSKIINCYLIRIEQFTLADDDGGITRIIFTDNISNAIENIKEMLSSRNIALESKRFFEKQVKEKDNN